MGSILGNWCCSSIFGNVSHGSNLTIWQFYNSFLDVGGCILLMAQFSLDRQLMVIGSYQMAPEPLISPQPSPGRAQAIKYQGGWQIKDTSSRKQYYPPRNFLMLFLDPWRTFWADTASFSLFSETWEGGPTMPPSNPIPPFPHNPASTSSSLLIAFLNNWLCQAS